MLDAADAEAPIVAGVNAAVGAAPSGAGPAGLDELSFRGGGDGDVVAVDVEARLFRVTSKRPSVLLWLDVDSALKRLEAGGWELRSRGEAFLLSPLFLLCAGLIVLGDEFILFVERGLDCLEAICCFCTWAE